MAFYTIRVNLGASAFPLLTELAGRTIIVPGQDEHYDRAVVSTTADTEKDKGTPQAFFMENVVPTGQGMQSINYYTLLQSQLSVNDFSSTYPLRVDTTARIILCPAGGKNYIYDRSVSTDWNTNSAFAEGTVPANVQVTTAEVNGITYIYYKNHGCYKYDPTFKILVPVVLVGLVAADIVAICASNGQLIAVTSTALAWSSLTDPTDFTPSLITGAGGGSLQEAQGRIIAVFTMAGGFIIYCAEGMVSARVSGNVNFPFVFTQIPGSGGILNVDQVSWQSSIADHFAWTTVGLQQVSSGGVKNILPELVDFIAGKELETFDPDTNSFTTVQLNSPMHVALHVVGLRYIVLSYGTDIADFDYALIYDLFLKRYGRLKITHRDCIEWNYPTDYGAILYSGLTSTPYSGLVGVSYADLVVGFNENPEVKGTLAFIQSNGTIKRVDFDYDDPEADGVLLIGKYQFVRNLFTVHQRQEWETVRDFINNFSAHLLVTLDGKTFLPAKSVFAMPSGEAVRIFQQRHTGQNFSILLKGSFNLVSGLVRFSLGGTR